ncbi:zinc finger protein 639-like isoform X4 [Anticarsia gemmatalis]|uniref:zinc finger protein 639-like isoform X4 n=1 Tax=Anticarsia gemmatalis TaxID=129554 RepID=UPI003F7572DA
MESSLLNGMCRCCASEGVFKDVKTAYTWMGEEEVYADMLKQCFDICLSTSEQGDDGGICEVCITQLRNAANFKKQVLTTEEQFKKHALSKLFKPSIIKLEVSPEDDNDSDDNALSGDDGYSGPEFEVPIKTEVDDPKPKKRAAASKASTSRAKKAKADNGETSTKRSPTKVKKEEKIVTKDSDNEDEIPVESVKNQIASRTERIKHRANIKEILLNSNATPIRRYGGMGYTCSYCSEQYTKPADLKKHTLDSHKDVSQANFMKNMNMSEYVVKLDITSLKCKLCSTNINTLEDLMKHLKNDHGKVIYEDIKNHIFPFKFEGDVLKCVMCPTTFDKYRVLASHMHIHYRNFICEVCDAGFVNRNSYAQHLENHRTGAFKCDFCPKIYSTQVKKRLHERTAHTHVDAMNRCSYCGDTFKDYRKREAHLAAKHGIVTSTPKCQACDKTFSSRKILSIHIKRDHLLERPHKCTECEMCFFSTSHLKNHMVKHTKTKDFKCTICAKSFGRKKTLNSHMKIHGDERFACEHCGRTFILKGTWKSHLRSKHNEIEPTGR